MIEESKITKTEKTKGKKSLNVHSLIEKSIHTRKGNKIFGLIGLIGFALIFVLALIYATPIARILNDRNIKDFIATTQSQNDSILLIGIGGLIIFCAYFMCRNSQRKTYYISNYVSGYLAGFYSLISSVICLAMVISYQSGYEAMPFDIINKTFESINVPLIPTTSPYFPIFFVIPILTLLSSLVVILQTTLHLFFDHHITDDNMTYISLIKKRRSEKKAKQDDDKKEITKETSNESAEGGSL